MLDYSLSAPAFIAGALTFLAPCTLPLVPGYLGFLSGASLDDLKDPEKTRKARRKVFLNGLFFIIGFTVVFIVLGSLAGLGGRALIQYRQWLGRIGGIFVILFGLFMLNIIKIPFLSGAIRFPAPYIFKGGRPINSLILGSVFGFGWTPCIGPVLGSVLTLAAVSTTIGQGALLLAIFSLGLAMPFLIIAVTIGSASQYIAKASRFLNAISFIGGLFLIFTGILLLANRLGFWVAYFYRVFDFIKYGRLIEYL